MLIFANRHHLSVVSDRGEVSSYLTNLGFKIQIMKLIISDGGRGRYWYILHLPATEPSELLKFIFCHKMTQKNERATTNEAVNKDENALSVKIIDNYLNTRLLQPLVVEGSS